MPMANCSRASNCTRWPRSTTALSHAYPHWLLRNQLAGQASRFSAEGQEWFSLFQPMTLGEQTWWIAVIAPESSFLPGTASDLILLVLISIAALICAGMVALRMAQRFARPLELLAQGSVRFGQLELQQAVSQVALQAPWLEVRQLAAAQEQMRQQLLVNTSELQQARAELEQKVAERTGDLQHQVALVEALLDTIPNPIFYKGADTRFIGCNQAYEQAFGITEATSSASGCWTWNTCRQRPPALPAGRRSRHCQLQPRFA
jgi:PAS domain-containing protein